MARTSRYLPCVDFNLLISTAGTVIVAAVGLWLQHRRATSDAKDRIATAEREAAERRETTAREAEEACRRHLLDERRAAYADLVSAALPWINKVHRRMGGHPWTGSGAGLVARDDPVWTETERALAIVHLLAPPEVGDSARGMHIWLMVAELETAQASQGQSEVEVPAVRDLDVAWGSMLTAMNADLVRFQQPGLGSGGT